MGRRAGARPGDPRPLGGVRAAVRDAARPGRAEDGGGARVIDYVRDGAEIYRRSFATIRAEADLTGLPDDVARVAVRMIHACGMTDLVEDLAWSPGSWSGRGRRCWAARRSCATRGWSRPGSRGSGCRCGNEVVCTLGDPGVPELAARLGTTRARRPLICGSTGWTARWSRSATRRPRCSGCWSWSRRARDVRRRSSGSRSGSSARPSPGGGPGRERSRPSGGARAARRQRDDGGGGQRHRQ